MISYQISDISMPIESFDAADIKALILDKTGIDQSDVFDLCITKRSVDARKKSDIKIIYAVTVDVKKQISKATEKALRKNNARQYRPVEYPFENITTDKVSGSRPVVIGAGPAGLFAAYLMAEAGLRPIIIERGKPCDERSHDVNRFWNEGVLDPNSNVSFGEGGAGTFSDGKLNTLNKDKTGRMRYILRTFVRFGADESILYDAKPHVGTDKLLKILPAMRKHIEELGGEYRFNTKADSVKVNNGSVNKVVIGGGEIIEAEDVVLAIGHSARDTFEELMKSDILMEAKPFAVGFRVEHPRKMIDAAQYGEQAALLLPAASYKLVSHHNDRGVFSFCMCPGGYVVNSSSEKDGIIVNGMSYAKRDGKNSNSAIVVSVDAKDFGGDGPMDALRFQRLIEEKSHKAGQGCIPQQLFGDFKKDTASKGYGEYDSAHKGRVSFSNLRGILPDEANDAFIAAMTVFGKKLRGFDRYDTIMSGIESRTSSPVRITRGDDLCSVSAKGLYPCGEGAGYAGGIMSAAADGLRVAEEIIRKRENG